MNIKIKYENKNMNIKNEYLRKCEYQTYTHKTTKET